MIKGSMPLDHEWSVFPIEPLEVTSSTPEFAELKERVRVLETALTEVIGAGSDMQTATILQFQELEDKLNKRIDELIGQRNAAILDNARLRYELKAFREPAPEPNGPGVCFDMWSNNEHKTDAVG